MTSDRAAVLRRRLADELQASGVLRSQRWQAAVEKVPRHEFVPAFFRPVDTPDRGTRWEPVSQISLPDRWLDLAYDNQTWVTQLDQTTTPHDVTEPVAGDPTSSSTLPSLVVRMLEDLDVTDGTKVLEIGSGTGYSTALMCERLGDERVTSIEVDPGVAVRAAAALDRTGYHPRLLVSDGLAGDPGGAPYDRVIATCSVRQIPYAWIDQARPGAVILATVSGWLHGSGLARLAVAGEGVAEGRFLPGTVSFMIARAQAPKTPGPAEWQRLTTTVEAAEPRPSVVGGDAHLGWTGRFVAQLAAPGAQWRAMRTEGGPWVDYYIDPGAESVAAVAPAGDGRWTVKQSGPTRLWDDIENAIATWQRAGSPDVDRFRIRTDGRKQTVWLDTTDGPVAWTLSHENTVV